MRIIVILLGLLAAAKIGLQEHLFRSGTKDVIVGAYREKAVQACQKDPRGPALVATPLVWTRPSEVRLVIGKSDLDVWFWQVDHALWNARYRNPYLFLVAGEQGNMTYCEYDVVRGVASVHRL